MIYIHYADCRIYMHRRRGRTHKRAAAVRYIYQLERERVSVLHIYLLSWLLERKSVFHCPEPLMALFFFASPLLLHSHNNICALLYNLHLLPAQQHCTTSLIQWFIAFKQLFFSSLDGLCYCCVSLGADNRFFRVELS